MTHPTLPQTLLIVGAALLLLIGGGISVARIRHDFPSARLAAKSCLYFGLLFSFAAVIWHSVTRRGWLPLEDNFDALIWLAIALTGFVLYIQRSKPVSGLDWFILPIVVLLLVAAAGVGLAHPQPYDLIGAWAWVHRAGAYGGAAAFAVAGAAGAMYLVANYRLRHRLAWTGPSFGSLERLEQLTQHAVTLGFALLTLGALTGFALMGVNHRSTSTLKIVLSCCVWLVYALALHTPINPSFRGPPRGGVERGRICINAGNIGRRFVDAADMMALRVTTSIQPRALARRPSSSRWINELKTSGLKPAAELRRYLTSWRDR